MYISVCRPEFCFQTAADEHSSYGPLLRDEALLLWRRGRSRIDNPRRPGPSLDGPLQKGDVLARRSLKISAANRTPLHRSRTKLRFSHPGMVPQGAWGYLFNFDQPALVDPMRSLPRHSSSPLGWPACCTSHRLRNGFNLNPRPRNRRLRDFNQIGGE